MSDDGNNDIDVIIATVEYERGIAKRNKRNRYKPSKLEPHRATIRAMRDAGKSYDDIAFAISTGIVKPRVDCVRSTVWDFVKSMDN